MTNRILENVEKDYLKKENIPTFDIGDTVDDARCARAANVPFIGIASATSPRRDELLQLLRLEGAIHVFEDINEIG